MRKQAIGDTRYGRNGNGRMSAVSATKPMLPRKSRESRESLPITRERIEELPANARVFLNGHNVAKGIQIPPMRDAIERKPFEEGYVKVNSRPSRRKRGLR